VGIGRDVKLIAAPRRRTAGKNMEGRAFCMTTTQRDFGVLELIMTAPVVVADQPAVLTDRLWVLKRSALATSFCTM
jgi:hypothetical protein